MAEVLRSPFVAIMQAIAPRLVAWPVRVYGAPGAGTKIIPLAHITISQSDPPQTTGDQDVVLRFGGFVADKAHAVGPSRIDRRVTRRLFVIARTRLNLDEITSDEQWLEHATLGHIQFEEQLIDALDTWLPEDAAGNSLVYAPIQVTQSTDPGSGKVQGKGLTATGGWGKSILTFDVPYVLNLRQNYPIQ